MAGTKSWSTPSAEMWLYADDDTTAILYEIQRDSQENRYPGYERRLAFRVYNMAEEFLRAFLDLDKAKEFVEAQ